MTFAHVSILTDQELIILQDDDTVIESQTRYGVIVDYIPLGKVKEITQNHQNDNLLILTISLDQSQLYLKFSPLQKRKLEEFMNAVK